MTATRRTEIIEITGEGGGGSYASLDPGEYDAILVSVEDYDNRHLGKTHGWIWTFTVEGLPFKMWTAFTEKSLWKLAEVVGAFDYEQVDDILNGVIDVDPNNYIGLTVTGEIQWEKDPATLPQGEVNYKRLAAVWQSVNMDLDSLEPPARL
jgi:hypothetical protein